MNRGQRGEVDGFMVLMICLFGIPALVAIFKSDRVEMAEIEAKAKVAEAKAELKMSPEQLAAKYGKASPVPVSKTAEVVEAPVENDGYVY